MRLSTICFKGRRGGFVLGLNWETSDRRKLLVKLADVTDDGGFRVADDIKLVRLPRRLSKRRYPLHVNPDMGR